MEAIHPVAIIRGSKQDVKTAIGMRLALQHTFTTSHFARLTYIPSSTPPFLEHVVPPPPPPRDYAVVRCPSPPNNPPLLSRPPSFLHPVSSLASTCFSRATLPSLLSLLPLTRASNEPLPRLPVPPLFTGSIARVATSFKCKPCTFCPLACPPDLTVVQSACKKRYEILWSSCLARLALCEGAPYAS